MKFYSPFERKRVSQSFEPNSSLTEQCYKDECSIDFIISNFVRTGQTVPERKMSYVDCTQVKDFQSAQQLVAETKSMFYSLPSKVRDEFKTVDNYLSYISDPKNLKDCYERGLIDKDSVDVKDIYPDLLDKNSISSDNNLDSNVAGTTEELQNQSTTE